MDEGYQQGCPVAVALDAIGDRWTLLVLRDLAHASMRFSDIQAINPRLSPNLLTKRLRMLQEYGLVRRRQLPRPAAVTVYELDPDAREELLPVLNALGRFGAYLFRSAPDMSVDALVTQMRLNGNWILAKGVDFEASYRFELDGHPIGLTVAPTVFEPSTRPPDRPTAALRSDIITMTKLLNAGITLAEAESSGALRISGDRKAALALLDRFALGQHLRACSSPG
jgi:DNA-binding HxlR family transcriptional regulator